MNSSTYPTPPPGDAPAHASAAALTVLTLYGSAVLDLQPRADLVLELAGGGSVTFALVRAYRRQGRFAVLPRPTMVSVQEAGRRAPACDVDAEPGERLWDVPAARTVHRLELDQAPLAMVLRLSEHLAG